MPACLVLSADYVNLFLRYFFSKYENLETDNFLQSSIGQRSQMNLLAIDVIQKSFFPWTSLWMNLVAKEDRLNFFLLLNIFWHSELQHGKWPACLNNPDKETNLSGSNLPLLLLLLAQCWGFYKWLTHEATEY